MSRSLEARSSKLEGAGFGGSGYNGAMPIFEYRCADCGKMFETFVTAERTPECPGCRSGNLAKLLSSPGMVGSGNGRAESAELPMASGCGMGTCGCRPN